MKKMMTTLPIMVKRKRVMRLPETNKDKPNSRAVAAAEVAVVVVARDKKT
jgi:hypothetical protein